MQTQHIFRFKTLLIAASAFLFISCQQDEAILPSPMNDEDMEFSLSSNSAPRIFFYGLSSSNELVSFRSGNPLRDLGAIPITGLQSGESVVAMDFRPASRQLYGVTNQSRMYIINTNSGNATAISMTPFTPAINGEQVGFDFNPTVDRIRLVTENEQNLRLHPETGMVVFEDGDLNPGDRDISAVAYTNSFAGATSTTLFDIDLSTNKLYKQIPPNNGTLVEVGSLQVNASGEGGFDISPNNAVALAVLSTSTENGEGMVRRFYSINLKTGKATDVGQTERDIIGLAIPTDPVAYAVSEDNQLMIFNPNKSQNMIWKTITGLQAGENVLGIDMRPVNGQLLALGSTSRLYVINTSSGAAAAVGAGPFTPALEGTSFGFDFNPTVDRIRIVSNTGQNLRAHPGTGAIVIVDGSLNPGMPMVDAAAYTNNFVGTMTTSLYVIDFEEDKLYLQSPPNDGTLVLVGDLMRDIVQSSGFDIGGSSGIAMGIFSTPTAGYLYQVNLTTGRIAERAPFPTPIRGFALGLGN